MNSWATASVSNFWWQGTLFLLVGRKYILFVPSFTALHIYRVASKYLSIIFFRSYAMDRSTSPGRISRSLSSRSVGMTFQWPTNTLPAILCASILASCAELPLLSKLCRNVTNLNLKWVAVCTRMLLSILSAISCFNMLLHLKSEKLGCIILKLFFQKRSIFSLIPISFVFFPLTPRADTMLMHSFTRIYHRDFICLKAKQFQEE